MDCNNQNLQSYISTTAKKDLVVNASSYMMVIENLLNYKSVLNTDVSTSISTRDTGRDPWVCPICHAPYKYRTDLAEHIHLYHLKGNVPCNKCSKIFPTSRLLREHMKDHSISYDKCPYCGVHFTVKDCMPNTPYKFHMNICNKNPKNSISISVIPNIKSVEQKPNYISDKLTVTVKCSKCSLEFENRESLDTHVCITLKSVDLKDDSKMKNCDSKNALTFKCIKCCLEFEDKESIENHICITLNSIEHLLTPKSDNVKEKMPLIWKCLFCTLPFEDKESFEKHECLSTTSAGHETVGSISSNPLSSETDPVIRNNSSLLLHEPKIEITEIPNLPYAPDCSQNYTNLDTSSPTLTACAVNENGNSPEKKRDSINVQINSVFSLTQDQWQKSEITAKEEIGSHINIEGQVSDIQNESNHLLQDVQGVPCISSLSSTTKSEEVCERKIGSVNTHSNVAVKYFETRRQIRRTLCNLHKKNETNDERSVAKDLHNGQSVKMHDETKELSLQSKKLNDVSDMEVDVTCGMCKSHFTKFNQFRFHFSLCKMMYPSTDDGIENKPHDAICNLCHKTFPIVTDYVIHLKMCRVISDNENIQKKQDESCSNHSLQLPSSSSLFDILTNCAILLLKGSDWHCIKCNCSLSSLAAALSHYSNCKSLPFSSDTSSFAKYIRLICTQCNNIFKEVCDFECHKEHCVAIDIPLDGVNEASEDSSDSIYENNGSSCTSPVKKWCPKCGHCCRNKHFCIKLLQHMQSCYIPLKQLKTMAWNSLENEGQKYRYHCKKCNKTFSERLDYVHHMENHVPTVENNNSEEKINLQNIGPSSLSSDVKCNNVRMETSVSKPSKTLWKCKSCQVIYTSLEALKQHALTVHDNKGQNMEKPLIDNSATLSFSNKNSVSPDTVPSNTPQNNLLNSTTNNQNYFKCMACNFEFSSNSEMEEHLKMFHASMGSAHNNLIPTENTITKNSTPMLHDAGSMPGRVWKCSTCLLSCTSPSALQNHMSLHRYVCSCGLTMNHVQATAHNKLTRGTHQIICNNLPLYKSIPSLVQGYFKCRMCFVDFHNESDFLTHMKRFPHCTDNCFEQNAKCTLCHLQFSNKDSYSQHLRNAHPIEYNKQSPTHPPNVMNQKWSQKSVQSVINNVVETSLLPTFLPTTSVNTYPASAPVQISRAPSQPSNHAFESQGPNVSKQLSLPVTESPVTQDKTKVPKSDGWVVLCSTNSKESTSNSSQVQNYVCSRCYRSQPTIESLSLHIKEDHKVHLVGDLNLGTIQAR